MANETVSGTVTPDTAARRHEGGRRSWRPYLTLIVLVQVALLLHLLPRDPAVSAQITRLMAPVYRFQQARARDALLRNDPKPGAKLLGAGSSHVLTSAVRRGEPAILVFAGFCSECKADALQGWERVAAKPGALPVVIISRDKPRNTKRFWQEHKLTLPVVPDPQGSIADPFNVVWTPRAYLMSADGRLRWIQPRIALSPENIMQAVRASGGVSK